MKRSEVIFFVNSLHRLILTGRTHEAADYVARPLVMYFPESVVVIKDTSDIVARMARVHRCYASFGITRIEALDVDVQDCTDNRAFVSLKLARHQSSGQTLVSGSNDFVLQRSDGHGSLVLELADFSKPGLPEHAHAYHHEVSDQLNFI